MSDRDAMMKVQIENYSQDRFLADCEGEAAAHHPTPGPEITHSVALSPVPPPKEE